MKTVLSLFDGISGTQVAFRLYRGYIKYSKVQGPRKFFHSFRYTTYT